MRLPSSSSRRRSRFGGWALIVVFAAAALAHVLHGQYGVGSLAALAAAALVVMAHRAGAKAGRV